MFSITSIRHIKYQVFKNQQLPIIAQKHFPSFIKTYCSKVKLQIQDKSENKSNILPKILYNDVLFQLESNVKFKKKNHNEEPICLKYLKEKEEGKVEMLIKEEEGNNSGEHKAFQLPYEIDETVIHKASINANLYEAFPEAVNDLTPSDNEPIDNRVLKEFEDEKNNNISSTNTQINDTIDDLMKFGNCDPSEPVSDIPCGGCGAFLHCYNEGIPGFLPVEIFKSLNKKQLRSELCQRCHFLREFDVALGLNVSPDEYPLLLSQIKNKKALVILMIDLLDFPCCIWPEISELIGSKPLLVVANKIDLFIQEDEGFLDQIKKCLLKVINDQNINMGKIMDIHFISAKTGYGIEKLVTALSKSWGTKGDIYLVGCTNVGKSTLFNSLIHSDLCRIEAEDILQRATISSWPGTTLNLLKFPIKSIRSELLNERIKRIILEDKHKALLKKVSKANKKSHLCQTQLHEDLRRTILTKKFNNSSFISEKKIFVNQLKTLDPKDHRFQFCKWFYDTPGVIRRDQIVNLLTVSELILTLPNKMIIPRNVLLKPGTCLFIGGLARLDYYEGLDPAGVTVFASRELPITVTRIEDAKDVYENLLGTNLFRVPCGGKERLKKWPVLASKKLEIVGTFFNEAAGDIVLSSAGWVSVTLEPAVACKMEAWTPEGRGIYFRKVPVIRYGYRFKGKRIKNTPVFSPAIKEIEETPFSENLNIPNS